MDVGIKLHCEIALFILAPVVWRFLKIGFVNKLILLPTYY